jgi:serine/threonine protein kinase
MKNIGKYITVKELGSGATSKVFLAIDPFSNKKVAIKLFEMNSSRGTTVEKTFHKLFLTESSLAGKLQHPHIVKIFDAVLSDDLKYLVMEYVDGGSLEKYTEAGQLLPFTTVAEIIFKCCKALEYAQTQGVIHRDIKPANILLHGESDIKLSDFGAAIIENYDGTHVSGVGSPAYMSPEQISDLPLTQQSDIYSLGVTMYKLLTGRLPFEANSSHGLLYQIVHGEPHPPKTFRLDIPDELNAIVQRAITKNLSHRYQNWNEFAQDLSSFFAFSSLVQEHNEIYDTEKFDILRSLSFFERFRVVELWEVLHFSNWRKVSKGTLILNEGDIGNTFFILANGTVKILKNGKVLGHLHKGEFFGEIKRLPDSTFIRSTAVETGSEVTLIEINLDTLARASVECRFQFDDSFLNILLNRLEVANTRISKLLA